VTWQRGPWQISYALQYIGGLTESVELDEGFYQHRISSVTYHDIECAYELAGPGRLRLGVTNLTDRDPPFEMRIRRLTPMRLLTGSLGVRTLRISAFGGTEY